MATALDQSIADLCDRHNLASATITYMRSEYRSWFHGAVQWLDDSKAHGRGIATTSAATAAEALKGAVASMLVQRGADIDLPADALELAA